MKQENISLNKFQKIARKLQHASFGMPGGRGVFNPIQHAIVGITLFVILKTSIKKLIIDWRIIVTQLSTQPTSFLQLVQELPSYISYSDAFKLGAGGFWFSGMKILTLFLCQIKHPQDIQDDLISYTNPQGHITMNDL